MRLLLLSNIANRHNRLIYDLFMSLAQGVHVLEDVGDTELLALAGGEILRTVKIINKEVRLASRIARAGADRLIHALTTVRQFCAIAVCSVSLMHLVVLCLCCICL